MATRRDERDEKRSKYASARKRAETHSTGESTTVAVPEGLKIFALKKAGIYRLDILPYTVGEKNPYAEPGALYYERTFYTHRAIGPNQQSFICPQKTCGKRCPVCEDIAKRRQSPDRDDDLLKQLYPKERQLFLILDRDNPDDGPQLWEISFHLFGKQLDAEIQNSDAEDNFENFFHAKGGSYLKIGAKEKTFSGNKFYEVETIHFKPRAEPLDRAVLADLPCLDELLKPVAYEELKKIYLQTPGGDDDDDDDDDDDTSNSAQLRRQEKARKSRDEDDEDDDEEPSGKKSRAKSKNRRSDDGDDDDDPPPKRGGKKAKPADDDDDETDVPDGDDDDDDPPPRPRKRGRDDEDDDD